MARISRYIGIDEAPWIHESFTCSFCGKDTCKGAFWVGHDTVVICDVCLKNGHFLGALLGDGVLDIVNKRQPNNSRMLMHSVLSQTTSGMYRAMAHFALWADPDMMEVERTQKQREKRELAISELEVVNSA